MSNAKNEDQRPFGAPVKRPRLISSWLVNALAVVFTVSILAAIFWPPHHGSRGSAYRSACSSNLKQIGLAAMQYMSDNDEHLPPLTNGQQADGKAQSWRNALQPYLQPQQEETGVDRWKCAANPASQSGTLAVDGLPLGYDVVIGGPIRVGKPLQISAIKSPAATFLAFEENGDNAQAQQIGAWWDKDDGDENWTNILYAGHLGTSNYLFLDGHVKAMRPLGTIIDKINRWKINNKAPVSPRALQKLQAAQDTFN